VDYLRCNAFSLTQLYGFILSWITNGLLEWNIDRFAFAVTPHNFTAIALNLAATLAMMGNVVLWKPASIG